MKLQGCGFTSAFPPPNNFNISKRICNKLSKKPFYTNHPIFVRFKFYVCSDNLTVQRRYMVRPEVALLSVESQYTLC